jgi:hypothetical protein
VNPSGGLRWHWRAWRSEALWSPTSQQIANWLASVQPRSKKLLLLGPSAGWMLPTEWLLRFESIDAMDLDPLAGWLFGFRHGAALKAAGIRWDYQTGDALAALPRLLTAHPRACVLLDNLLGQLRFHAQPWQNPLVFTSLQLAEIKRLLHGREWGSVHDLLSGPATGLSPEQDFPATRCVVLTEAAEHQVDLAWLGAAKPQGEWLDHLTDQVFPAGTRVDNIAWAFSENYWHWLQAGWVQPSSVLADAVPNSVHGRAGWNQLPLLKKALAFDHLAAEPGPEGIF